jgi:hypothetical protein
MDELLDNSVSKSTTKAQSSAWSAWLEFTTETATSSTAEVNPGSICFFLTWMFAQTNRDGKPRFASATMKKYVSSVKRTFHEMGVDIDMSKYWAYHQLRRAVKKSRPSVTQPPLPITAGTLDKLYPHYDHLHEPDCSFWAMLTVGVSGLFRLGELAPDALTSPTFPRMSDLRFTAPNHAELLLHSSKTDVEGKGVNVHVPDNNKRTSAVTALRNMGVARAPDAPLFANAGLPITRRQFINRTRAAIRAGGLDDTRYSGHSLRKGGAQSLFDAGIDLRDIACAGRWTQGSTSIRLYRHISANTHAEWACKAAATTRDNSRLLDFDSLRNFAA